MLNKYKNEGTLDRLMRLLLSEIIVLGGYFWFGGLAQIALLVLGFIVLITAITGFCGVYKLFDINTISKDDKKIPKLLVAIFVLFFLVIAVAGSYFSVFFSKKFFLDDYSFMNNDYKQTLFYTGQENREESIKNYDKLVASYSGFYSKYTTYHPYSIKSDASFNNDLIGVSNTISSLKDLVYSGDLKQAHTKFESVRPIFQDILKRNNFSMFAVALVDFHDSMEKIISASDSKDSAQVITVYLEVSDKLKAVEEISNDSEIQLIRQKLEELLVLAHDNKTDELSAKAAELKNAFVKVYLKRG